MTSTLYLIRHASAGERGPRDSENLQHPDDTLRPLDPKGHKQAKTLAEVLKTLDVGFDRLFSSPYTRAAQTAESLAGRLAKGHHVQYLDALAEGDYPQLLVDLREGIKAGDETVALVGHEPFLGGFASYFLTGSPQTVSVQVRKATLLALSGSLAPGEMTLQMLLPATVYKPLTR